MGKPQAPKSPDPKDTSAAQTGSSVSTALANTALGNVNQTGPDGSTLTYNKIGSYAFKDPFTKQKYRLPQFEAVTNLSPEAQRIYDLNQQTQMNVAGLGRDQSAMLRGHLSEPFSYSTGDYEKWAGGVYDDLTGEDRAREMQAREAQLANQGLVPGSEAYDAAMRSTVAGQGQARNQFMLDAYETGLKTALAERNQPLNEVSALMSGSQVSMPQFGINRPNDIPTTDNAGLINESYNQKYQNYVTQMNQWNQTMGGLFGLGAALVSDRRLKKDVEQIGHRFGLPIYLYRYRWESDEAPLRKGYMAQDVLKVWPQAVARVGKFFALDYEQLPEVE